MSNFELQSEGTGTLRPRARLLRTVGDELISSDVVAVLELVKNAYDADATRVLIRFKEPLDTHQGEIEIIDNGHGMSLDTIQNAWMEPATSYKKRQTRSKSFKRRVLGEKGIGRFAASKLADYLEVITRSQDSNQELKIFFDWSQFDDEQKFLDQIQIQWQGRTPIEILPGGTIQALTFDNSNLSGNILSHGTILRMQSLRSSWTEKQFKALREGLARLISPFLADKNLQQNDKDSFLIYLDLPENFAHLSGQVEVSEALRHPHYSIAGSITASGHYMLKMHLRDQESERTIEGIFLTETGQTPQCGPFTADLRVWDRDALNEIATQYNLTVRKIQGDLDSATGVNIYRDGFRVLPYGERRNDWLQLNARRVNNPTLRLSTNQVVGYVLISADENPDLRDQSNREGIVDSQALDDLRDLITQILAILEAERYRIRQDLRKEEDQSKNPDGEGIFANFTLVEIHNMALRRHPEDSALLDLISEKETDLEQRVEKVQTVLSRYLNLATLGSLVDMVLHEGRTSVTKIRNQSSLGKRRIKPHKVDDCESILKSLDHYFSDIQIQADVLTRVFQRIEPFSGRNRGKAVLSDIQKEIANAVAVLEASIGGAGVKVEIVCEDPVTLMLELSEIQSIIVNLMQNSLFWLRNTPKNERRVVIQITQLNSDEVEILFSDNGTGVSVEDRDHIFEPYFSRRASGTGLGLTIVGEIVHDYYSGILELVDNGPLPGATFRIILHGRR